MITSGAKLLVIGLLWTAGSQATGAAAQTAPSAGPQSAGSQEAAGAEHRLVGSSFRVLQGQTFCVCGRFPGAGPAGLTLDGRPLAAPTRVEDGVLYFPVPEGIAPGLHHIVGDPELGFGGASTVCLEVLAFAAELDSEALLRGQSTKARFRVEGSERPIELRLQNLTPEVIRLQGGDDQVITFPGGQEGSRGEWIERRIQSLRAGEFNLSYTLEGEDCPCRDLVTGSKEVGGTTTEPPVVPPERPTTPEQPPLPPYPPPYRPPPENGCDCCCHQVQSWDAGTGIQVVVASPAEGGAGVQVPLGDQLPLAAVAKDTDVLTVTCQKEPCGDEGCPACSSSKRLPLPGSLTYHWELISGAGELVSKPPFPHPHSAVDLGPAALYQAPDRMPADPQVTIRLVIDDSPEYLADIDDPPVVKLLQFKLVNRDQASRWSSSSSGPSAGAVGAPASSCSCQPEATWAADRAITPRVDPPGRLTVCAGGFRVLATGATDRDQLATRCVDKDCPSPVETKRLNDALQWTWRASAGRILGSAEQVVFQAPAEPGTVTVQRIVDDSGFHGGAANEVPRRLPPLTLDVFRVVLVAAGDYIVPGSAKNLVRYKLEPSPVDEVVLEVFDKDFQLVRTVGGLPKANDATAGYAEAKWDGKTDEGQLLTEARSPYTYRLIARKGDAACRLLIPDRKVKEWDFVYRISDRGRSGGGGASGASGVDAKTVVPTLVKTLVKVDGGDQIQVPVYKLEEQIVNANDRRVKITLLNSFATDDKHLLYTSPTAPEEIGYEMKVESSAGGALDQAGNEWDMDPAAAGIQRKLRWTFVIDDQGELKRFREEIPP